MTILSVTSTNTPAQNPSIALQTYRAAIAWILDFNSAVIPSPTSVAALFWNGQTQLSQIYWSTELKHTFQSILAFPLRMFHANGVGNVDVDGGQLSDKLPHEFYTNASIAVPHNRIIINTAMFSIFVLLQSVVHLFIWAVLAWLWIYRPGLPVITSYPLFNVAFKTKYKGRNHVAAKREEINLPNGPLRACDRDVVLALQGTRHFLRTDDERLGLLSNDSQQQRAVVTF
ncbi:hypothetical protein BJX62DRAFT_79925 [Aspergillus germanicus]